MAAARAAALSFWPPLAALTAAMVAAALVLSTCSTGDAPAAGVAGAFFFFAELVSFGGALRTFLDGDALALTAGSATTGAGLFDPAKGPFEDFDPFDFLEFPLLEVLEGGCELGYMGGMCRGGG